MINDTKGTLIVRNKVKKQRRKDEGRKFNIFINGPGESLHTVSLGNGESIELNNLDLGVYTVYSLAPINYELDKISNKKFIISTDSLYAETTISSVRVSNSWFSSE